MNPRDPEIEDAARLLRDSRLAIAFTGAGISVASGIPDFRSPGGLWSKYDPWEVASIGALRSNPDGVWKFLLEAIRLMGRATPNPTHQALARMEENGLLAAIVTQNIDGLHKLAGSRNVIEFHGTMDTYHCMGCARGVPLEEMKALGEEDIPVFCDHCGALVRPDIVFFGEGIPQEAMIRSSELAENADLVIVAGTSGEVAPANLIPRQIVARGGRMIEINLGPTAYGNEADLRFDAPAEQVLPLILEAALNG